MPLFRPFLPYHKRVFTIRNDTNDTRTFEPVLSSGPSMNICYSFGIVCYAGTVYEGTAYEGTVVRRLA